MSSVHQRPLANLVTLELFHLTDRAAENANWLKVIATEFIDTLLKPIRSRHGKTWRALHATAESARIFL